MVGCEDKFEDIFPKVEQKDKEIEDARSEMRHLNYPFRIFNVQLIEVLEEGNRENGKG